MAVMTAACLVSGTANAQTGDARGGTKAPIPEGKPAVIERAPLQLRDPQRYQIPLHLEATRSVNISVRKAGVISSIQSKLGDTVAAQTELARLDTKEQQLELARAQALYKAALADKSGDAGAARVDAAKAELDLAQLHLDYCNIRTPLAGIVVKVSVVDGQFVQPGEVLFTIVDPKQLQVELPVDGKTTSAGTTVQFKVGDEVASAPLQAVLPLNQRFEALRDLFVNVASGVAVLENANNKYQVGQTVYSSMIPRQPVAEVPNASLSNGADGNRKVQVLREGFIRDIPVQLLGAVGDDHLFVTGRFGVTDELILKSSEPLLDGARVSPATTAAAETNTGAQRPAATKAGF
jgi:multidrug efflux pump subunit AcrA (membrane-fusion protein)